MLACMLDLVTCCKRFLVNSSLSCSTKEEYDEQMLGLPLEPLRTKFFNSNRGMFDVEMSWIRVVHNFV